MKSIHLSLLLALSPGTLGAAEVALFDGKTFTGWDGDTNKTWRIEGGAFVGGSLAAKVPRNEFMRTRRAYKNFVLRVKFKLLGTPAGGFINGGVQVRSEPADLLDRMAELAERSVDHDDFSAT